MSEGDKVSVVEPKLTIRADCIVSVDRETHELSVNEVDEDG